MLHDFEKLEEKVQRSATILEEVEFSLWDKWVDEESPDTFGFLELAKDGGFSEVKLLYTPMRWLTAAILVIFVIYNIFSVFVLDYAFMTHPSLAADQLGTTLDAIDSKFYFSRSVSEWLAPYFGFSEAPEPVRMIGLLELLGMSFFLLNLLYCCGMAMHHKEGFRKWFAVQTIFWDILPTLSVYSAMRLLYQIVPLVFLSNMTQVIEECKEAKGNKMVLHAIYRVFAWIFTLVFCFIIGFDTFLMKLRIVSAAANSTELNATVMLSTVQFLIQVMGVVQLGTFVRQRLFVFIFGGEDAILQDGEIILMETWNALLAKRIFRDLPFWHAIAVMSSFSDEDFQSLVMNENEAVKTAQLGDTGRNSLTKTERLGENSTA